MSTRSSGLQFRETRATIDLDALRHNIGEIKRRFPSQGLAPAVKADAYGHGAAAIATECADTGVEMMSVANLEEFLNLRDHGVEIPILVLEDLFPAEIDVAIRAGARLNVGSPDYAREISDHARRLGVSAAVHLNIDTGMGRMGFLSENLERDLAEITALPAIEIDGIYSHLSSSDEGDVDFTSVQVSRFREALEVSSRLGIDPPYRHIANSGAILELGAESIPFNLLRPGIAVYGIYPSEVVRHDLPLRPVLSLTSRLIKVTRYDRRWSIGYGKTYWTSPGQVIGVIPIGYGDGYPRALSNNSRVLVGGQYAPVVGRVSMDMITVDLTDISPRPQIGDPVVIIGAQRDARGTERRIDAQHIANECQTIPYEITCNLSTRVPRLYYRAGELVASQTFREGYRLHAPVDRISDPVVG